MINKIMDIMNNIEYGFKDKEGNNIIVTNPQKWDRAFADFYYLQTPEELLQTKCGVCWDQVELERDLFIKNNIECKTFFIYIFDKGMLPSHTFLTYEENDKFYWFEHSWEKYKGIHEYSSEKELLQDIINKFRQNRPEAAANAPLYLFEYQRPKKHIKCDEFYKFIETQKEISL